MKWFLALETSTGMLGADVTALKVCMVGMELERNMDGRRLLEFCDKKDLCVANTWFRKPENRKVTYSAGGNETEIDFVSVNKEHRKYTSET